MPVVYITVSSMTGEKACHRAFRGAIEIWQLPRVGRSTKSSHMRWGIIGTGTGRGTSELGDLATDSREGYPR